MSIIKCKMCGGDIELSADKTFGTCECCGSQMTFPKVSDEQRLALFNRGNAFRRAGEFDKALALYENIVREDDNDAEAHWCCALCRFGIEYVEDPATLEYIPTCHRASFDNFLDDVDYKAAVENADGITKKQYQKDALKIADVQKGILATSQNEQPFDVFICYKETDDTTGQRTKDSIDAQEIYYHLTNEGYRVFFSRITLEDKAGAEYEPYIFAALNSAKVMVVIGSKAEYFNAVWVKNEWSRFIAMMRKDRSKLLIPCYRGIDPYDLPEQLSVLQSYDMAKIGFMQDLIHGIKKVTTTDEPKAVADKTVVVNNASANTNIAPLLERVFLFLEDGKWQDANIYCEKVLDQDPKNAEAYLGKLMAELKVKNRKSLADCAQPFDDKDNFAKVIRFGDEALEKEIRGYIAHIKDRNETAGKNAIYDSANIQMTRNDESAYKEAIKLFESIIDWKDSRAKIDECNKKIEEIRIAEEKAEAERKRKAEEAKAKKKKTAMTVTSIVAVIIIFLIVLEAVIIPEYRIYKLVKKYGISEESVFEIVKAKEGETVTFGSYEQDNNTGNGKEAIEWRVLEVKDGKALIISEKALDCAPYNEEDTDVTWETCTLRTWLNGTFYKTAFSSEEQKMIQSTKVTADANPDYDTDPGNDTTDKVFLLSITEVEKYFGSSDDMVCKPTDYAAVNGAYVNDSTGGCWWWLRSPGCWSRSATSVDCYGSVGLVGVDVSYVYGCVRPALWIEIG